MSNKKLTPQQKKLVEDNYHIIEAILNLSKVKKHQRDELTSQLEFDLCTAAINYDESKGASFYTYASKSLRKSLKNAIRKEDKKGMVRCNSNITEDTFRELVDITGTSNDELSKVEILYDLKKSLNEKEQIILYLILVGFSIGDISKFVSQSYAKTYQIVKKIREITLILLNGEVKAS